MPTCYIFDVDGTLADCQHRIHHIKTKPKNWDAFFGSSIHDKPIKHVVDLAKILNQVTPVIFCSGRPERCRIITTSWLIFHLQIKHVPISLYMRKDGDYRDDQIVKAELYEQIIKDGWVPQMAFDDRNRVVEMWRHNGIPCAQVAPGDF